MFQVFDCEQNTPEWAECRRGIPTASEFKTVLRSKGKSDDGSSVTRRKYLYRLVAERITGEVAESYENQHTERGHIMEPDARALYAFLTDDPLTQVGFIRDDDKGAGCSPDSLVGDVGVLEIKTALPHLMVDYILKNEFPPEHKAQTQGVLWLAQREWVDICIYWPSMPKPFIKRAYRDPDYILNLASEVAKFNEELDATVERVRRYGMAPAEVVRGQLERSLA